MFARLAEGNDLVDDDLRHRVIAVALEQERVATRLNAARIASMCAGSIACRGIRLNDGRHRVLFKIAHMP